MSDHDTAVPALDDTTHPCGSCGERVPVHQEYCGQCGARQPAVADTAASADAPPAGNTTTDSDAAPIDLVALQAEAAALIGHTITFRKLSRRERELRATPDPDAPPLPNFVLGRCEVVEARGAWVLLEHSTGARGWCPVGSVKPRRTGVRAAVAAEVMPTPSTNALLMIEALERLHTLHASGGLTDDEFTQAKQRLLATS